jgi:heme/copper-type cytochrome/quinol oxidase subunit 2
LAAADVFSSLICTWRITPLGASLEILKIMDWIPTVFVVFKVLVLGTGMYFAIKWHYDQGKKKKVREKREVLRASGVVAAVFVISLLGLGFVTFELTRMLGM